MAYMTPKKVKIVVTGGPSGGKTTLIEALQRDLAGKVSIVPEAASILYRGGFPRKSTVAGRIHAQRAICFTQRELEDLVTIESKTSVIVCDRGSLDSIAYWPSHEDDFYASLQTTRALELKRYDWVIHLDTAEELSFDGSNPIRTETHKEAVELNTMIREAWQGHERRIIIPHFSDFLSKMTLARSVIERIMSGEEFTQISSFVSNRDA
ncbi:MAG: ATP-binding protein [Pseudobdellovibrionaceae bacterium]|jgi:nicotinamide riboside kinase